MLDLIWYAKFNNGTIIPQYEDDKQEKEHTFKEVLDKQEDLESFALLNVKSKNVYIVNLKNGTVSVLSEGDLSFPPDKDMLRDESIKYRLIYFRRVSRTFGSSLQEIGEPTTEYFLGFQYTDKEGRNHKRLIKIDNAGRLVIN